LKQWISPKQKLAPLGLETVDQSKTEARRPKQGIGLNQKKWISVCDIDTGPWGTWSKS